MIYKTLKTSVMFCRPNLGFEAKYFSARYLSAAGAMFLLCDRVDSNIINLIGSVIRCYANCTLKRN